MASESTNEKLNTPGQLSIFLTLDDLGPHDYAAQEGQERATAMADAVFFRGLEAFGGAMDTLVHTITAEEIDAPGPGGKRSREAPMVRLKAAPKMRRIVVELGGPEGESAGD